MTTSTEPVALYARITRDTKDAVDGYAAGRDLTLAGAVQQLLDVGLETERKRSEVHTLQSELDRLRDQLGAAEQDRDREAMRRERAESEFQTLQNAAAVWSNRAAMNVGFCPGCKEPLTGEDLLVAGRCRHCGRSAAELLAPPKASGLDDKELMMVLGAAGLLLGLIAISGKR